MTEFHLHQPFLKAGVTNYHEKHIASEHISSVYSFETDDLITSPSGFTYIPTGCVELLFVQSDACNLVNVIGTTLQLKRIELCPNATYFGVRLKPGAMISICDLTLKQVVEQQYFLHVEEHESFPMFFHQLRNAFSLEEKTRLFLHTYESYLSKYEDNSLTSCILDAIYQSNGNLRVHELANTLHYSERHLSRIFLEHMGVSPKSFSRVVRFQSALSVIIGSPNVSLCRCLLEFGYSDQAHFQREFKQFTGITPKHFATLANEIAL